MRVLATGARLLLVCLLCASLVVLGRATAIRESDACITLRETKTVCMVQAGLVTPNTTVFHTTMCACFSDFISQYIGEMGCLAHQSESVAATLYAIMDTELSVINKSYKCGIAFDAGPDAGTAASM